MSNPEFEALMRGCGARIYTLALRLTGNASDAQDLAQETFLKAYENFARFRGEAEFSSWTYRICVNLWKNRVRYEKRRSFWRHISLSIHDEDEEGRAPQIADGGVPLDSNVLQSERHTVLQRALQALDPEDRAIIILRDIEDRPYEEIAEILSIPLGTVKSRLARSRDKLRDKYTREETHGDV